MKPQSYWQQRSEQIAKRQHLKADRYAYDLGREYGRAVQSIQRDIEAFYGRFAENNEISLADARKMLTAGELREIKMTLEEFTAMAKNNADGKWTQQLNNVYYRTRVSRLEALQLQIRQQVEMLAASKQTGMRELLGDVYEDTYYRTLYEIQRGTGIGASFAKIDQGGMEKVLGTEFAGSNWSKRIWGDRDKLAAELHTKLTQSFIRGDSVDRTVREVVDRFRVSHSNARRLVQTESSFFTEQATMDSYHESGIVDQYEILATLDSRTSNICQEMDGKVFKLSEMDVGVTYPPFHAYCRTTTVPYFDDEEDVVGERIARDADGQTYYVPGDITYTQWKRDYVDSSTPPNSGIIDYKHFASEQEARNWEADVTPEWLSKLTDAEKDAITKYSGTRYRAINEHLRGIRPDPDQEPIIDSISSGLRKFGLTESITVYRGWDDDIFNLPIDKLKGLTYRDPAFYSSSLLKEKAEGFSRKYLAEVRIPAGTTGAMIRPLSEFPHEYEVLIDKGTTFRILEASERSDGIDFIMEVVRDE